MGKFDFSSIGAAIGSFMNPKKSNGKSIDDAITHFNLTGEVKAVLYPGFDQDGRWRGIKTEDGENFDDSASLRDIRLSPKQYIKEENGEKTLLTSFISNSPKPIEIGFDHIIGRIETPNTSWLAAPNLKTIQKQINVETALGLELPKLVSAGVNLSAPHVRKFEAPELKHIKGRLELDNATTIELPKLEDIGWYAAMRSATTISAPKLKRVKGNLYAPNAEYIDMPELEKFENTQLNSKTKVNGPAELRLVAFQHSLKETIGKPREDWIKTSTRAELKTMIARNINPEELKAELKTREAIKLAIKAPELEI